MSLNFSKWMKSQWFLERALRTKKSISDSYGKPKLITESNVFAFLLITIAVITHQIYLRSGWMMNPDESELLGTARLARMSGGINQNYTTSTHGPIWPEFLALLSHMGMSLDHFNAHLLALILKLFVFVVPQFLAVREFGIWKLGPILIALNVTLFLPTTPEFSFLATEFLPLAFLTLAVFIILEAKSDKPFYWAGILFSMAFLAKYQSLLMIAVLISFTFLGNIQDKKLNLRKSIFQAIKFFVGIFAGLITFLGLLVNSNSLRKFFEESFLLAINYSTAGGFGGSSSYLEKLNTGSVLLVGQPLIIVAIICTLYFVQNNTFSNSKVLIMNYQIDFRSVSLLLLCLFFLIGFLTISIPGNGFPHYLLFFAWTLVIYLLALVKLNESSGGQRKSPLFYNSLRHNKLLSTSLLIVAISLFSFVAPTAKNVINSSQIITDNETRFRQLNNATVLKYCPRGSQVLVWGWSAELFSYFDWLPTPNIVNDVGRIKFSKLSPSAITRIESAISNTETDCIYEAIGVNYFGGFSLMEGIELLPKRSLVTLKRDYVRNQLEDGTAVWSRRNQ